MRPPHCRNPVRGADLYARGFGGQILYVVPGRALTVTVTSDPTRPARKYGHVGDLHRLVRDEIIRVT